MPYNVRILFYASSNGLPPKCDDFTVCTVNVVLPKNKENFKIVTSCSRLSRPGYVHQTPHSLPQAIFRTSTYVRWQVSQVPEESIHEILLRVPYRTVHHVPYYCYILGKPTHRGIRLTSTSNCNWKEVKIYN